MSTNLAQLEMRLGVDWFHLRTARQLAASKRLELRQALEHLDSEDTSIVVSDHIPEARERQRLYRDAQSVWTGQMKSRASREGKRE